VVYKHFFSGLEAERQHNFRSKLKIRNFGFDPSTEHKSVVTGTANGDVAHLTCTSVANKDQQIKAVGVRLGNVLVFHVLHSAGGMDEGYVPDNAVLNAAPEESSQLLHPRQLRSQIKGSPESPTAVESCKSWRTAPASSTLTLRKEEPYEYSDQNVACRFVADRRRIQLCQLQCTERSKTRQIHRLKPKVPRQRRAN